MMENEIHLSMNKPVVFFSPAHVLIVPFFPPLAFPGINLVKMDFKTEDRAVNVMVHQTGILGNVWNRTRALYCISNDNYLVLKSNPCLIH